MAVDAEAAGRRRAHVRDQRVVVGPPRPAPAQLRRRRRPAPSCAPSPPPPEPTPLYAELHAAADAALDAILAVLRPGATADDVVRAAQPIEDAGFTTRDGLLHGFVGGYRPPVLGSPSRQIAPVPDFTFTAGMTVVVQPNVVTRDETAGVQTGELVLIGDEGPERVHAVERGLLSAGR